MKFQAHKEPMARLYGYSTHTPSLLDELRANWREVLLEGAVLGLVLFAIGAWVFTR